LKTRTTLKPIRYHCKTTGNNNTHRIVWTDPATATTSSFTHKRVSSTHVKHPQIKHDGKHQNPNGISHPRRVFRHSIVQCPADISPTTLTSSRNDDNSRQRKRTQRPPGKARLRKAETSSSNNRTTATWYRDPKLQNQTATANRRTRKPSIGCGIIIIVITIQTLEEKDEPSARSQGE